VDARRWGLSAVRGIRFGSGTRPPDHEDTAPDGIRVWTQYAEARDRDAVEDNTDVDSIADAALIERTTALLHNVVLKVAAAVIRRPGSTS
jgi:hypothetical protein